MQFPRIETIDDVAPFAPYEKGFVTSRRGDHTVIDYVFATDDTFATPMSLECRGLKFDRGGKIIARPFHKFFNVGEKLRPEDIDWAAPHHVLAKLDGSMVHPVLLDGALVFMTRMGATKQAVFAQSHAGSQVLELSRHLLEAGITPIFEFTSPETRVVIAYDTAGLTLLAAREIVSGAYLPQAELERLGRQFDVPLVATLGSLTDPARFIMGARGEEGIEGYVIAFESGFRLKLKTAAYALRHKALSGIEHEKNILAWVATEAVDDVLPLLAPEIADRVRAYHATVGSRVSELAAAIAAFTTENAGLPRKDFADLTFRQFDRRLAPTVFAALDGKDIRKSLLATLNSAALSETRVDAIRDLFGMTWSLEGLDLPDLEG